MLSFLPMKVFPARVMMRKGQKIGLVRLLLFLLYRRQLPFKHRKHALSHLPQVPLCIVEQHRVDCLDSGSFVPALHTRSAL